MAQHEEADMMDIAPLVPWLGAVSLIISTGTAIYSMVTGGSKRNSQQLQDVNKTLVDHDRRIQSVEADIKHLPDRETIHKLELFLEKLNGRLDSIDGRFDTVDEKLKPIQAATERMNEALMAGGKR